MDLWNILIGPHTRTVSVFYMKATLSAPYFGSELVDFVSHVQDYRPFLFLYLVV
jgi:hypothetical protein